MSDSLGLKPTRLPHPWASLGKNTGVGCGFLLQGIFPTQGPNPRLLGLLPRQVDSSLSEPPGKAEVGVNSEENSCPLQTPRETHRLPHM